MADPTKYEPTYSYVGFQQEQQDAPFPGTNLDNDLAKIASALGTTIDALKDVRRADGALVNGIVTVDSLAPAVKALVGENAYLETVSDNIADITAVADDIANVNAVGADLLGTDTVGTVAADLADSDTIGTVAAAIAAVGTVSSNIVDVNTVAGISANVTTVAGVSADVSTVAGISAAVSAVAAIDTDVSTVSLNVADVQTVAGWIDTGGPSAANISYDNTTSGLTATDVKAALDETVGAVVRHDEAQGLTEAQMGQARANVGADILAGFRNNIINGDFDIWQRGTSFTAGGYTADRWRRDDSGLLGTVTITRQPFTVGQTEVPGNPKYFFRIAGSSATHTSLNVNQKIEGVRTLAGKTATLTFWAKASAARDIRPRIIQTFGTGGSPSPSVETVGTTTSLTTSWQKFTQTISVPSISGKTLGSNGDDNLRVVFDVKEGGFGSDLNSDLVYIAHASVVEGDATSEDDPFSPRHIQQELALCQRYYYLHLEGDQKMIGAGGYLNAGQAEATVSFPVPMLSNPSLEISAGTDYYAFITDSGPDGMSSLTLNRPSPIGCLLFNNTEVSGTAGEYARAVAQNANARIAFVAEI